MMTLPPERDLPGGDRMADEILAGVEPARPAPGRSRALLAVLVAAAAVVVVALVLVQLLPLGRETAPAEPSPSPVVSAEPGTVADLGGGNTATVSSVMVLESYPVQFVYVGEVVVRRPRTRSGSTGSTTGNGRRKPRPRPPSRRRRR